MERLSSIGDGRLWKKEIKANLLPFSGVGGFFGTELTYLTTRLKPSTTQRV
jgi:hypothetical protein